MHWKIAFYLILWCLKKKDWGRRSWYSAFLDISGKCKTSSKCQCRQLSNKKMLVFQPRNWLKSFVWDTWHIRIGIHVQIREKKINSIFHNMIVVLLNNDCILCYEMSRLNEGIILQEMKTTKWCTFVVLCRDGSELNLS